MPGVAVHRLLPVALLFVILGFVLFLSQSGTADPAEAQPACVHSDETPVCGLPHVEIEETHIERYHVGLPTKNISLGKVNGYVGSMTYNDNGTVRSVDPKHLRYSWEKIRGPDVDYIFFHCKQSLGDGSNIGVPCSGTQPITALIATPTVTEKTVYVFKVTIGVVPPDTVVVAGDEDTWGTPIEGISHSDEITVRVYPTQAAAREGRIGASLKSNTASGIAGIKSTDEDGEIFYKSSMTERDGATDVTYSLDLSDYGSSFSQKMLVDVEASGDSEASQGVIYSLPNGFPASKELAAGSNTLSGTFKMDPLDSSTNDFGSKSVKLQAVIKFATGAVWRTIPLGSMAIQAVSVPNAVAYIHRGGVDPSASSHPALQGQDVHVGGEGSNDPAGTRLSFGWAQTKGPDVDLRAKDDRFSTGFFSVPFDVANGTVYEFTLTVANAHGLTDTAKVSITVNSGIVVTASVVGGTTLPFYESQLVELSADGNTNNSLLEYAWRQKSGTSTAVDFHSHTGDASLTVPAYSSTAANNTLVFEVTVRDDRGQTATDTVSIVVSKDGSNTAPIARAGGDQTVREGTTVTLNGSGSSDRETSKSDLNYFWTQISGNGYADLQDSTAARTTFTAPEGPDVLVFELTVVDEPVSVVDYDALLSTDTVTITITSYSGPTANAGPDRTAAPGDTVTLSGSGATSSGSLSFYWDGPNGAIIADSDSARTTVVIPAGITEDTELAFILIVTDDRGRTSEDFMVVSVDAPEQVVSVPEPQGDASAVQAAWAVFLAALTDAEGGATVTVSVNGSGDIVIRIDPD